MYICMHPAHIPHIFRHALGKFPANLPTFGTNTTTYVARTPAATTSISLQTHCHPVFVLTSLVDWIGADILSSSNQF